MQGMDKITVVMEAGKAQYTLELFEKLWADYEGCEIELTWAD